MVEVIYVSAILVYGSDERHRGFFLPKYMISSKGVLQEGPLTLGEAPPLNRKCVMYQAL